MPTPLEDHGGLEPPPFHRAWITSPPNRLILYVRINGSFNFMPLWNSLLLQNILAVFLCVPEEMIAQLPKFHPLVVYIPSSTRIQTHAPTIIPDHSHSWCLDLSSSDLLHPRFWSILEEATPGTSLSLQDPNGRSATLYSVTPHGIAEQTETRTTSWCFSDYAANQDMIQVAMDISLQKVTECLLQPISIDTRNTFTPLCYLATKYGTDKSAYNLYTHRHPYTPVYDMFLRQYKHKPSMKLGEVGVLNGSSINMWKDYFPTAQLTGFDINKSSLEKIAELQNVKAYHVDAGNPRGLRYALAEACEDGKKFDILIDDASHWLSHQLIFLREAIPYMVSGGVLVIEDIFREIPYARFEEVLREHVDKVSHAYMIDPEHNYRFSPGWENDRMLFVWIK
jgi:SAM-dependent methyltransferase